jgi:glycosyltransferase involved in cell wall biosynthesis
MGKSIWFVLDVRYPTEKAYGVTTGFTAQAVKSIGNYNVNLITPEKEENSIDTVQVKMPFYNMRYGMFEKYKIFYILGKYIYPLKLAFTIKRKNSIIWLRDIRMAVMFSLLGYRVICEVHRSPSGFSKIELKFLSKIPKTTIVYITEYLRSKLNTNDKKSIVAGMAIKQDELLENKRVKLGTQFIVGYVGSSNSSGNKLSIDAILEAASILEQKNTNVKFRLIGSLQTDYELPANYSLPQNIEFLGRIPRLQIIDEIDKLNAGLVIYPDSDYFLDSFPIKIVEYAARQVPIIASNTRANNMLLGKDKALFFNLDSGDSLAACIALFLQNPKIADSLSSNAFQWAKFLTYENRARIVLRKADPEFDLKTFSR